MTSSTRPNLTNTLFEKYFSQLNHPLSFAIQKLLSISEYAGRYIHLLKELVLEDDCLKPFSNHDYRHLIKKVPCHSQGQYLQHLRWFRHRQLLRLVLREQAGLAKINETLKSWSSLADVVILNTLAFIENELQAKYGLPYENNGTKASIYTLAMGKLGGFELNFSSDIDLIFAYSAAGYTNGPTVIDNQQYYTKVVQLFIQILQQVTADGFVFRVDLRLRPNGESGALVCSLAALETYYQEQGREWERYAMVKARLIGEQHDWYNRLITPFVYKKYIDFSVIESLRGMKSMIEREVKLNPRLDDIKRGFGGIREVEFIVQNIQLVRGGRMIKLQQTSLLGVIKIIQQEGLLSRTKALEKAYLFLRKLENYLQVYNDQQTHVLPIDFKQQMQLAWAMNYDSWEELLKDVHRFQRIISKKFRTILAKPDDYEDDKRLLAKQLSSLWQGHVEESMAINLLSSLGYKQAGRCYQLISTFRHSPRCRRLSQTARIRLDRFMPILLNELINQEDTEKILLQVMRLLENIVGRSAYLALLTESPLALNELLYWFAHSPLLSDWLVKYPFLLEKLLEEPKKWHLPSRRQLAANLENELDLYLDIETQEELLRQFKLNHFFLIARAELLGQVDAIRAGRFLADLAAVIINQVINLACKHLLERYPNIDKLKKKFAVVAYGKFGSREMNYQSDLDLVFLHHASEDEGGLMTRLTQKIMHMLTTRSQFDVLYQVDTRLRPSGSAGLLVTSLQAFIDYQQHSAWVWEHQALIRSRIVFGSPVFRHHFTQLKGDLLTRSRNKQETIQAVKTMREKITLQIEKDEVKQMPGGLLDLEFLVQCLILTHPHEAYSKNTHTLSLLKQLFNQDVINASQFNILKKAYKKYHQVLHLKLLRDVQVPILTDAQKVAVICQQFYLITH